MSENSKKCKMSLFCKAEEKHLQIVYFVWIVQNPNIFSFQINMLNTFSHEKLELEGFGIFDGLSKLL